VAPIRGSAYIKARFKNRPKIKESDFDWIGKMADAGEIELLSFWVFGQPVPDTVGGWLRAEGTHLNTVIETFISHPNPGFDVSMHPAGQPSNSPPSSNPQNVGFKSPSSGSWVTGQPSLDALDPPEPNAS
jgi:hypothetical protein